MSKNDCRFPQLFLNCVHLPVFVENILGSRIGVENCNILMALEICHGKARHFVYLDRVLCKVIQTYMM